MAKYKESGTFVVGQSETSTIKLNERVLTGVIITGSTTSGSLITFLVSENGTDFYPLYDSTGTEVYLTVTTVGRAYNLNPEVFMPWNYVKARLGTSSSAVLQATRDSEIEFIADSM
jgi:hypothetical protein